MRLHVLPDPDAVEPGATIATDYHPLDPSFDGPGAEQALLHGVAGILPDDTWVLDSYDALASGGITALRSDEVASLSGTDAASADSPMRVIPADETRTEEELDAAMDCRAFLHAYDVQWAPHGHLPIRQSVIDSRDYAALPHRESYADRPAIAQIVPRTENQRCIDGILSTEFHAIWLSGTDPQADFDGAQSGVERILRRSPD